MADRYWVGGTAAWDATAGTKWALTSGGAGGQAIPTLADDVFFDGASGAVTCTISSGLPSGAAAKSITCTGFTGTLAGTAILGVAGSITLVAGMTFSYTGILTISGTATVTSAGKTFGSISINGTGITVTLADAMTLGTTSTLTLTAGTLALAGFTLSTGTFSSSNSNTRAISFSTGNIAITNSLGVGTNLSMATATGFTWTGTGGFTRNNTNSTTLNFGSTAGGTVSNAPNLTVTGGPSSLTITSGSYFKNVIFTGSTSTVTASGLNIAGNLTLATGGAYTAVFPTFLASATVTSNGKTLGSTTVNGSGITVTLADAMTTGTSSTFTLTQGTLNLAGFTLSTGIFSSSGTSTRAISFGAGNIALTSTTASTTVLSMAISTNFTFTGTGGFTRNMAATATVAFGTQPGGTVSNAPNLTVNAGASALTITSGSFFKDLIFTGSTSTVTASNVTIGGNLTLASGGTYTAVVPTFRASATVTSAGRALGATTINGSGITVTLADALQLGSSGTGTLTLTEGAFNAAGFNVSIGTFSSSNTNTRTLSMGSGTWTIYTTGVPGATVWNIATSTNMTLNPSTSTINLNIFGSSSPYVFSGGGLTYYNLSLSRADAFSGSTARIVGSNTFNNITNTSQPLTFQLTAGTTQTVSNFGLSGTAGNLVTINSTTGGSQATLSKASGTVNAQYLSIQDSIATGGATWDALTSNGNVNAGNNTGWIFGSAATGNMFLMFN